ncbi:MAG: phage terminase large subunit [Campylobacterales bacterium]|nr:phage terminase large subunit [Campylobacterales bacterium]
MNGEIENKELLEKLVNDFPTYLDYVYYYIGLPNSTPLQQRIATILGNNPRRLILEAARGVGKSWIGAIYTTWRLLRNVDEKILIVSASGPKAIEIATFIRRLFEDVPLLHHLRPSSEQRDSVLSFDVNGAKTSIAPSVSALGVTSQITGKRATLVLADDVEVPSNSATELLREKLINRTQEFEALLIPDMYSSIIYLGTPQSMESIYNKLEYKTVILPAQVPEDVLVYDGKLDDWVLAQGKPGDATDKVRFPNEVLIERKAGMGIAGYKLQYMLDTTLTDKERFPLKQSDMIVYPLSKIEAPMTITYTGNKEYALDIPNLGFTGDRCHKPIRVSTDYMKYDKIIMSIDPSGSGTDETTWCIIGVLSGNVYVLDWGGTRLGYSDEALMTLALKAEEYKVNEIVPEKNFGSGMFTELFRKVLINVYPVTIVDDFRVKGQKETRILDNLLPLFGNHQIIFDEDKLREEVEWVQKNPVDNLQYSLIYQLTHLTYEKGSLVHDDRVDALAIGCQYVSNMVIVDADKRLAEIKEKEFDNWLNETIYNKKNFMKKNYNILGNYRLKSL